MSKEIRTRPPTIHIGKLRSLGPFPACPVCRGSHVTNRQNADGSRTWVCSGCFHEWKYVEAHK